MSKRKSLKLPRKIAFEKQNGCCYYCGHKMWTSDIKSFAKDLRLTIPQARQHLCTGEHLMEHARGGKAESSNIVAACYFCNQRRHRRQKRLTPEEYKCLVKKRLDLGSWHCH